MLRRRLVRVKVQIPMKVHGSVELPPFGHKRDQTSDLATSLLS